MNGSRIQLKLNKDNATSMRSYITANPQQILNAVAYKYLPIAEI